MNKNLLIGLIVIGLVIGGFSVIKHPEKPLQGIGNDPYMSTSTAESALYGGFIGDNLIKTGWGTLGSVVITGANTGIVNFINATTSDITQRTGQRATTSLLITSLPASLVAGTYVYDIVFTDGLLVELEAGLMPTTTITYK